MTKSERAHMGKVAELGCCICRRIGHGNTPAQVHHVRTGIGMGKRAGNFDTIPLCPYHHTGNQGVHGMGRKAWERHFGITELELLEETRQLVGMDIADKALAYPKIFGEYA